MVVKFCSVLFCLPFTFSSGKCNYILFTELLWPGDSDKTFRSNQAAITSVLICLKHTVEASYCPFLMLIVKQESYECQFLVFGLTWLGIEFRSTILVADALSPPLPVGLFIFPKFFYILQGRIICKFEKLRFCRWSVRYWNGKLGFDSWSS